jgi:hypothetical protein
MADLAHTQGAKSGFAHREYAQGKKNSEHFPDRKLSRLKESWLPFEACKTSACNGRLNGVFAPEKGCYSNLLFNIPTAGFFIRKLAFCQLRKIQEIWR